jgi:hypothetical protein
LPQTCPAYRTGRLAADRLLRLTQITLFFRENLCYLSAASLGLDAFYDIVQSSESNKEFLFISRKLNDYYEDAEL